MTASFVDKWTSVSPISTIHSDIKSDDQSYEDWGDFDSESLPEVNEVSTMRINLTTPSDQENELVKLAAQYGPPGILAVMRSRKDYTWITILGLRAIEVCLRPRTSAQPAFLRSCDPVAFSIQMLEMEMVDEVFMLMKKCSHLKGAQAAGLSIIELLTTEDPHWRDEVARKGGARLICDIAKEWRESPRIMCLVMTCMSYLAAEDYIEIMLCQHDALEHVAYALRHYSKNAELVTRACLALLNLTVCESHVEELVEKDAVVLPIGVLENYHTDVHVVIIVCGILANFSVNADAREILVEEGVFKKIHRSVTLDPSSDVLQIACLKALVNYSTNPDHYMKMEDEGLPSLVGQMMVDHGGNLGIQKYGNMFLGEQGLCPIL
mmetsp:Transcript_6513/g.18261  ORF Transcript_6513/g.18261 Transcript_6513/m.18261 type:complete len:379 (-) Transcript_6513:228-1364(-)